MAQPAVNLPGDETSLDRKRLLQQQLVLLMHAKKCEDRSKRSEEVQCRLSNNCVTMRKVLRHMYTCDVEKSCTVAHCSSSKQILKHFRHCTREDCPFCLPFKEVKKSRRRQWLIGDELVTLEIELVGNAHRKKGKGLTKLGEDFGQMLASGEGSDITVRVKGAEFRVHKFILLARSPVFAAMFRHETAEKASNEVSLEDCEPEVFKEYLQYLYIGDAQFNKQQNAFGLYRIADKYLADDLKEWCLQFIREKLCVETFCNTLRLAFTHDESGLLEHAMDFASKNIQSILGTKEWQDFAHEYPTEADEVLAKCGGSRRLRRKRKGRST